MKILRQHSRIKLSKYRKAALLKVFEELKESPIRELMGSHIPKGSSFREIAKPHKAVKRLQREFLESVSCQSKNIFSENSVGGIKGKSVKDAIQLAESFCCQGQSVVLKIDFRQAFSNVDLAVLRETVLSMGLLSSRRMDLVIEKWLKAPVRRNGRRKKVKKGLHTGIPVAPFFFNVLLTPLDCYLESKKYSFYRYLDDLALFFKTEAEANKARIRIERFIAKHIKLPINTASHKTCIQPISSYVVLLGYRYKDTLEDKLFVPANHNIRQLFTRLDKAVFEYKKQRDAEALGKKFYCILDQWLAGFPAFRNKSFEYALISRYHSRFFKRLHNTYKRNRHARYRLYVKLLGKTKIAWKLADSKPSEFEGILKRFLIAG